MTNNADIRTNEALFARDTERLRRSLVGALGIRFLPVEQQCLAHRLVGGPLVVQAVMDADGRTCHPFGSLSGGASLALAETLAGYGSMLILPQDVFPAGASVSANHISPLPAGKTALATATLIHEGHSTHVWNVDVTNMQNGTLVSTIRVLNKIVKQTR